MKKILQNLFNKDSKTRIIVLGLFSVLLVFLLLIGSTYSIYVSSSVDEELNVYTTGNLDVTYTLSADNINFENSTPTRLKDSINITPYRITVNNAGNVPYAFNLILNDTTTTEVIDYQYIMVQVGKNEPIKLSSTTNNIIKENIIAPAGESVAIDVRIWISDTIQNTETSKSFYAKLSVDGVATYNENEDIDNSNLIAYTSAASYIKNLYHDGSSIQTVNIGGDSSKPQVSLNHTQDIMLDNNGEYRYYGANPNNYVKYNNELWRIISVGNVKSSKTDTQGSLRVKIVKADILKDDNNLSAYSYDSSASSINSGDGVNDWSKSDLMTELNTLYFNSTSGTCYTGPSNVTTACNFTNTGLKSEARNLTADALYYLGGNSTTDGVYPNDYYTFERGTTVYSCSSDSCGGQRATTWTGRVGIIYPSDYAYATDLSVCTKDPYYYDSTTDCYGNDWLLYTSAYQWTISPVSSSAKFAFCVYSDGYVNNFDVFYAWAVRPVQYLKTEVMITGGEGTSENPYQLAFS